MNPRPIFEDWDSVEGVSIEDAMNNLKYNSLS